LTFAASKPSSRDTAQACAANASFDSMISMSPTSSAAFLTAKRVAGMGPRPHIERLDARVRVADQPRHRFQTEAADGRFARQHDGRGAVIDAGRITGGDTAAVAFEHWPQPFEVFGGSIMPHVLVGIENGGALAAFDLDAEDLLFEIAGVAGRRGAPMTFKGERILIIAGNAVPFGHVLGRHAHQHAMEGIAPARRRSGRCPF
jgi:hypothetical protein